MDQLDSFIGATVQVTRYSKERKIISLKGGEVISGVGILTNNQVNILSSVVCALLVGWLSG